MLVAFWWWFLWVLVRVFLLRCFPWLAWLDVLPLLAAGGGEVAEIQISELGPCGSSQDV